MKAVLATVTQEVLVTVDESKFSSAFIAEFKETFYNFNSVNDHVGHLAQLYARGVVHDFTDFIEGYGSIKDMGISFEEGSCEVEVNP